MSGLDKIDEETTKLAEKLWELGSQHSIDKENYWDYIKIWRGIASKDEEFGATFLLKIASLINSRISQNSKTDDLSKKVRLNH